MRISTRLGTATVGDEPSGRPPQHEDLGTQCVIPGLDLDVPWVHHRIIPGLDPTDESSFHQALRVSQDVSQLQLEQPFGKITLRDMLPLLPADGTVRFAREYSFWAQELGESGQQCPTAQKAVQNAW
eukprot:Skav214679  [mRNA]  locus=scaffold923:705815:706195:+ [translate_table: standard]